MRTKKRKTLTHRHILRLLGVVFTGLALLAPVPCVRAAASPQPTDDQHKPYALIFGTVWGPDSRPVYGVKVKIRRADEKKARWELMSDHRGEFAQRVPAGKADYVVWADIKTSKDKEKPAVKVAIQNDERADVSLHLTE